MADANINSVSMTEKQKVKEITDKLEEGLKELFESEKYKSYLSTMSKFHNYSFNNTLLIAMQKPEATLVAGYKAWQKNFERHVNKGEKAIRILAPMPYKIKEKRDKLDPVTGEMTFDGNGMPHKEEVEVTIPAFRVVSVFDVSQTDGKPIPELEAQELITGIEEQLKELQRDREVMQDKSINGLEKESLLLVQNSGLSEYSLLSVRGMDTAEIMEALSAMNDDDRLSIAAYLESRGAWTAEIANEETKEFGEYHIDVRYNTDTNEITDLKKEMAWDERAKDPIGADDVILKITHADGFEVECIINRTPEEVQEIVAALTKLENKDRKNIRDCLESCGADYIPIIVSGGRNDGYPQFNDFEIDLNKKEVEMMSHLSSHAAGGGHHQPSGICTFDCGKVSCVG